MNRTPRIRFALGGILLAGGILLGTTGCATGPATSPAPAAEGTDTADAVAVGAITNGGTTILASASVGTTTYTLGQNGTDIRFGASFDGSDPDQNWETFGETADVAANGFTMVNPGNSPDAAPGGLAHVTGQVGADVASLDIITDDGSTAAASMSGGYYVAAWEGMDFWDRDTLDAQFVLTLSDGSSTTVSYREMSQD